MSLTKLSLGGNNIYDVITPAHGSLASDIPAGDGNIEKLFLRCRQRVYTKLIVHVKHLYRIQLSLEKFLEQNGRWDLPIILT
jgi:hypothetical protein